ncbi:ABC transporter permease [Allohahella marinimesophila]|uniref:ABC transporter permease subunit n=1 Tax=Allohahella marinimesophila TaxID=1054972 RepID=A0ABP7NN36_9GAMM
MILRLIPVVVIAILVLPVLAGLILALLPAFGYLPVLGGEQLTLEPWLRLFASPGIWRSVGVSYATALVTTGLSLLIVFCFLAAVGARQSGRWSLDSWLRRLVSPLLSVPHAAAAFGFAFLIMPSGLLTRWISPGLTGWERPPDLLIVHDSLGLSLMAGLVMKEVPFLLLMSLAALPQVNAGQRVIMARSLGYRPGVAWLKVVAPALYPLIRLPVYAVLAFASSTVDVAMILGPTLPPTLSVQVVQWFNDPDLGTLYVASAGAIAQLLLTAAVLLNWWLFEQLASRLHALWVRRGHRSFADRSIRSFGRVTMSLVVLMAGLGFMALALNAFAGFWRFPAAWPASLSADAFFRALPTLQDPLLTTLVIAAAATILAVLLVIAALEREQRLGVAAPWALWLLYLPLLVPQIAFLSGITVSAEVIQSGPSLALVAAGHLLFVLPYVYLALAESYRRLDPRWSQLARSLGSSMNGVFWRVRLPLLLAPILTAAALGFAISISQYLPTRLLGAGRITTVTTEAVALAAGGDRRLIGIWSLVQALLPFVGFAVAIALPGLIWRNRRGMREIQ